MSRPALALALPLVLALAAPARAQEPAPAAGPSMAIGGSLTVWLPSGDADDFSNESLGVRPHFAYWVRPFVAIVASLDFVLVNEKDGVGDITYYNVAFGGRLTTSRPAKLKPYGELLLGWHKLDGENIDDSGIGFRIGGGGLLALGGNLVANFGLGYSAVSIDAGFVDVDVDALVLEAGLAAQF